MTSKSWAKSLLPTLALGLVTTACSGSTEASSASTKVLTVAASAAVTTWDPVRSFSTEALYLGNVYEPLLWKNPGRQRRGVHPRARRVLGVQPRRHELDLQDPLRRDLPRR